MAESQPQAQERTEKATPKRRREAREKGQVPRSRELATVSILLASAAVFYAFGGEAGSLLAGLMRDGLTLEPAQLRDTAAVFRAMESGTRAALLAVAPLLVSLAAVAVLAPLALGGWVFSAQALRPRLERLDPLKGLGRLFSLRGVVELAKALAKVLVVGGVAVLLLWALRTDLGGLAREALQPQLAHVFHRVREAFLVLSAATLLIALVDVPYQIWQHGRQLRMTRQEVKDELKETEGRPEVRSRIRSLQREMAQRRMMDAVPGADVVVTNPTHYAVALAYDPLRANAPRVVAKGVDHLALRIREVASRHGVPVIEAPPLARALYATTDLEQEIPAALYVSVAHLLAYLYQLRAARQSGAPEPEPPRDFDVPEDLQSARRPDPHPRDLE